MGYREVQKYRIPGYKITIKQGFLVTVPPVSVSSRRNNLKSQNIVRRVIPWTKNGINMCRRAAKVLNIPK